MPRARYLPVKSKIAKNLLRWYGSRRRSLPWRDNPRPYAVWVAEIMAQQTRLETMLPYYKTWMKRFPNVRALSAAKERDVLSLWEGLGYYSRARNLRKTAQVIVKEHGGRIPRDFEALRMLPGIGPYTAGAIASLAFGSDRPAVDGNASRVLARVFDVDLPANSGAAKKTFWQLAAEHLPSGEAAAYNQALMDLGAQVCTPRNPKCNVCPLRKECRAFALGVQEQRPVRTAGSQIPVRKFAAAVIRRNGRVLLVQRPTSGLLGGMWEFPNTALSSAKQVKYVLRRRLISDLGLTLRMGESLGQYEHTYSHFTALLQVYDAPTNGKQPKVRSVLKHLWVPINRLGRLPMGKLDRNIAISLQKTTLD
jgi:A/G-specific adenine glycosylase